MKARDLEHQNRRRLHPPRHDPHHATTIDQIKPLPLNSNFLNRLLELPLHAGGNPDDRCARPALRAGSEATRRVTSVVAIGGNTPSAGAEIVMGVGPVEGRRRRRIPGQVLAVFVLVRCRQHVRLVLRGTITGTVGGDEGAIVVLARIAGRPERMRPAEMQTVGWGQFLAHDQPRAIPSALILEIQIRRNVAMHAFDDAANRRLGRKFIHYAELGGVLIRSILIA
jgi:hypothetical protein